MKTLFITILIFIFILFISTIATAQGLPGPPVFPDSPDAAPIDGGLGLLAAAGGTYALKKLRDKKKDEKELEL